MSLHVPMSPATRHLIGERELRLMKPTATLVNAARGGVVDEAALVRALREGWIASAGLDVQQVEPNADPANPLLALPNCVVLPHIGSATLAARVAMIGMATDNVIAFLEGRPLHHAGRDGRPGRRGGQPRMTARIALVTGSAQGMGRAIAEALAASGHQVVGVDRLEQDAGPMVRVLRADLASPEAHRRSARRCRSGGRARQQRGRPRGKADRGDVARRVRPHDRRQSPGPVPPSRGFGAGMRERGWGRIINIASIAARTGGMSQVAAYGASKAGLVALTKNFARNYGPDGVTVNAVAPAAILTPMAESQERVTPGAMAATAATIPASAHRRAVGGRDGGRLPRLRRRRVRRPARPST